jgi:hypothetical protein
MFLRRRLMSSPLSGSKSISPRPRWIVRPSFSGHGFEVLRSIGPRQQLIDIAVEMSEAEIRAYVIADNKLAENAGWIDLRSLLRAR